MDAVGPNQSGSTSTGFSTGFQDADLNSITQFPPPNDICVARIDFVTQNVEIEVSVKYVLGSDEWSEFLNFNDPFGLFINGVRILAQEDKRKKSEKKNRAP